MCEGYWETCKCEDCKKVGKKRDRKNYREYGLFNIAFTFTNGRTIWRN